jgi:hypothetical protein
MSAPEASPIKGELVDALMKNREKLVKLESETAVKVEKVRIPFRVKLIELFKQRQVEIDKIPEFWVDKMTTEGSHFLVDTTIDPRILRAVTRFCVEYPNGAESPVRTFRLSLRGNIYTEAADLWRTVDTHEMKTVSCSGPPKWKPGMEKSQSKTVLNFFYNESSLSPEQNDLLAKDFEALYSDPQAFKEATSSE